ncbi:uncharacterized protein LOC132048817 [Lycium ferocissimum]|uniref:uncharacterized protein LOC132048817 n=1 Tax=Lycium ferocissimum TaxID=112874 RepID=UPI002814F955|nr:uncharacterized protein LOC132048817 [Lycium ferocissimum]
MVADMEDRVYHFVADLGPHLIDNCTTATLQPDMDIFHIQAYTQNLEDRKNQRRMERERDRSYGSAPLRFPGPRFDKSSYFGVSQSSRASGSQYRPASGQVRPPLPRCAQYGRQHAGQCRLGLGACYACGQPGHKMREWPTRVGVGIFQPTGSIAGSSSSIRPPGQGLQTPAGQGRGRSGASSSSGPQHRVYALAGRQDRESSPDVVTDDIMVYSPSEAEHADHLRAVLRVLRDR